MKTRYQLSTDTIAYFRERNIPEPQTKYPEELILSLINIRNQLDLLKIKKASICQTAAKSKGKSQSAWTYLRGIEITENHQDVLDKFGIPNDFGLFIKKVCKGRLIKARDVIREILRRVDDMTDYEDLHIAYDFLYNLWLIIEPSNRRDNTIPKENSYDFCMFCHRLTLSSYCKIHTKNKDGLKNQYSAFIEKFNRARKNIENDKSKMPSMSFHYDNNSWFIEPNSETDSFIPNSKTDTKDTVNFLIGWAKHNDYHAAFRKRIDKIMEKYKKDCWNEQSLECILEIIRSSKKYPHMKHIIDFPSMLYIKSEWQHNNIVKICNEILNADYTEIISPEIFALSIKRISIMNLIYICSTQEKLTQRKKIKQRKKILDRSYYYNEFLSQYCSSKD